MYLINQKTELRLDPTREPGYVAGYASKFGGIDSYDDTIEPTAYDAVVAAGKLPKMLFNHQAWEVPVGRWTSWKVDDIGLYVEGLLNLELDRAQDIHKALKFGSLDGLSVSIYMNGEDFEFDDAGVRHIKNVQDMREISLCTFPADKNARIITFKTADDELAEIQTVRDLENYLRDAGLPAKDAKALISTSKRVIAADFEAAKAQRDAAEATKIEAQQLERIQDALKQILTR